MHRNGLDRGPHDVVPKMDVLLTNGTRSTPIVGAAVSNPSSRDPVTFTDRCSVLVCIT